MPYKRIYAPSGEPFDVPETRATDLILQKGWTQQAPVVAPKKKSRKTKYEPEPEFGFVAV